MFKVGDRVKDVTIGVFGVVAAVDGVGAVSVYWDHQPGEASVFWPAKDFAPVTEESDGPVRTVTRKEIVEGDYGPVTVEVRQIYVFVNRDHACADKLREAIATLQTLLGALE